MPAQIQEFVQQQPVRPKVRPMCGLPQVEADPDLDRLTARVLNDRTSQREQADATDVHAWEPALFAAIAVAALVQRDLRPPARPPLTTSDLPDLLRHVPLVPIGLHMLGRVPDQKSTPKPPAPSEASTQPLPRYLFAQRVAAAHAISWSTGWLRDCATAGYEPDDHARYAAECYLEGRNLDLTPAQWVARHRETAR